MLVSHDEMLLRGACNRYIEVRGRALHAFVGGYDAFLTERQRRAEAAAAARQRLAAEAEKLESFITRFGAKATKASAAKSKQKALDKVLQRAEGIEDEAPASGDGPGDAGRMSLRLPPPLPGADEAIVLEKATFGWGRPGADNPPQLQDVSCTIERGMRVAVLGPNGAGKSTLLRAMAGTLPLWAGRRRIEADTRVAVFTQDLAQELPQQEVALEYVLRAAREVAPDTSDERARTVLGTLGLSGSVPLRPIGQLSGGEKARVVLAAFVLRPCHALLLDEVRTARPRARQNGGLSTALAFREPWQGAARLKRGCCAFFAAKQSFGCCGSSRTHCRARQLGRSDHRGHSQSCFRGRVCPYPRAARRRRPRLHAPLHCRRGQGLGLLGERRGKSGDATARNRRKQGDQGAGGRRHGRGCGRENQ